MDTPNARFLISGKHEGRTQRPESAGKISDLRAICWTSCDLTLRICPSSLCTPLTSPIRGPLTCPLQGARTLSSMSTKSPKFGCFQFEKRTSTRPRLYTLQSRHFIYYYYYYLPVYYKGETYSVQQANQPYNGPSHPKQHNVATLPPHHFTTSLLRL